MPKRGQDDEEKPGRLSTYTVKLDDSQMESLRSILSGRGWEKFDVAYARYAFKGPDCNVTAYESGKLVVAGKGTEEFVTMTLEPEVTMAPRLGYDEVLHPDWFELHAGLDESGKGDLFGPVVAATVIADRAAIEGWIKAGVKDSKRIADTQIIKLDKLIRGTHGTAVATCFCGMAKYNLLMSRPNANLNRLLAWQHATALAQALSKKKAPRGLLDQFSKQPLVQRELAKMGVADFDLRCGRRRRRTLLLPRPRSSPGRSTSARCTPSRGSSAPSCRRAPGPRKGAGRPDCRAVRRPGTRAISRSFISAPPTRSSRPRANWTSFRFPCPRSEWSGAVTSAPIARCRSAASSAAST